MSGGETCYRRGINDLMTKVNNMIKPLPEDLKKDAAIDCPKERTGKLTREELPADCAGRSQNLHSGCFPHSPTTNDRPNTLPENIIKCPHSSQFLEDQKKEKSKGEVSSKRKSIREEIKSRTKKKRLMSSLDAFFKDANDLAKLSEKTPQNFTLLTKLNSFRKTGAEKKIEVELSSKIRGHIQCLIVLFIDIMS
ncbi:hypothetical protein LSH36_445g01009 [Paralvinella palmiformis]|uniref:Uncharacterized protein n=1 Tax=Paralvinella palmiformis TaxID=53620 RepID=A0AAD9JBA8_9ANNE|nr:hypothetical protein LSH36_445g01009 [Paralvinella palmiformis]